MVIKLLEFTKTKSPHKYKVVLDIDGRKKTVRFGASGMSDFTKHKDPERKKNYIARHKPRENWTRSGVGTAGFWARHITWGDTTSIKKNLDITLRRFRIKDARTTTK